MKEKKNPTPHHSSGTGLAHTIYQKRMRLVVVKLFSAKNSTVKYPATWKNSEETHQRHGMFCFIYNQSRYKRKEKELNIYLLQEIQINYMRFKYKIKCPDPVCKLSSDPILYP